VNGTFTREDPNGNQIIVGSNYVDTIGRTVPPPPGTSTTDFSGCTGPLPIVSASIWTVPGPNGGTINFKFCNVTINVDIPNNAPSPVRGISYAETLIQSIVLPNGTTWIFAYNDRNSGDPQTVNYGIPTEITLPSGGTISYTYKTIEPSSGTQSWSRWVTSRTVNANDGTGPHTWNYSYVAGGSAPTTTVTDPLGNNTVHTFTLIGANYFEAETQFYQLTNGVQTLLKTVQNAYTPLKNVVNVMYPLSSVVPKSATTTWPNGQVSETQTDYDLQQSGVWSYGNLIAKREYDFGTGAPGGLLRTTTTQYEAFINSTYLTNNLLAQPSSVQITNGGGTQQAYTTYGYDEYGLQTSGMGAAQQHDLSPADGAQRGNPTSVHRWLNGSAIATTNCNISVSNGYLISYATYYDSGTKYQSTDSCGSSAGDSKHTTSYSYSSTYEGAYPTTITNPLSQSTIYTYDLNTGLVASIKDPNSQTTSFTYDNMWRLATGSYPDGGSATITHQETTFPFSATLTKKITSSQYRVETNVFDGVGRVSQNQLGDPQGTIYTDTTYDADGRKASVSNPYRAKTDPTYGITSYVYDGIGRTCVLVPPDGTAVFGSTCPGSQPSNDVFTTYAGSQTTVTDQRGITRTSKTDGLGRLTNVWESPSSVNYETIYNYDTLDDLFSVVQGSSHNRSFNYDSLKRLTSSTNPETGSTAVTYTYDADSNVITKKDARGFTITYGYDALNRMSSRTYSNGDPSIAYTYDQTTCVVVSTCYNIGRRTGMTDAAGSEAWAYDTMGREWGEQRTTNSITKTASYTYDLAGDLATLTYPSGRTITYSTDSAGRPSSAKDVTNNVTYIMGPCLNGISNIGVCYAPQGAVAGDSFGPDTGNYITHEESYNNRLQPNRTDVFVQGGGTLMSLSYGFVDTSGHNNGNVMSITNNVDTTRTQSFAYDQLNRLITAATTSTYATSPAHCWGEAYVYDNSTTTPGEFGNLTNINVASTAYNGCTQEGLSVAASATNQIIGFSYDASGNVLNDTHNSYAWNAESEIKTAGGVNYTYDGDGNRVQKSNGKIYWYGAGSEVLDESDSSGNITDEYVFFGGQRAAHRVVSTNAVYYYAQDMLGTSRQIYTSVGAVCYDADFYPFGGERAYTNTCAPNYKFEGKERDTETNNDDFGARYYSSAFGRWTSPDWSSVPAPVPYANLTNPQTLNLYAMVSDNPETFADLDGHDPGAGSGSSSGPVTDFLSFLGQELVGVGKTAVNLVPDTYNLVATVLNAETADSPSPANLPLVPTLPLTSPGQVVGADIATLGLVATGLTGEAPPAGTISENAAKGKAFQDAVFAEKAAGDPGAVQNVTVKTQSGVRTVIDVVSKDASGRTELTEAKSSATARLTGPQRAAHPEIAKTGATVAGKGKPGYPGGTRIPPTQVNVVRPKSPE
jgi:RHS repeat-associated protein